MSSTTARMQIALRARLHEKAGRDRDRALARRLTYGAVQRMRTLDHAIETLAGARSWLDPPVRAALRLGAYQLGFLEVSLGTRQ